MQQIDKKDLVGSWEEKAIEHNGEIRPSLERAIEWIFNSNGKAIYKYTDLKKLITNMDSRERYWDLMFENGEVFITIDDEPHYKIVSFDNKKMVAERVSSSISLCYHFEKQW